MSAGKVEYRDLRAALVRFGSREDSGTLTSLAGLREGAAAAGFRGACEAGRAEVVGIVAADGREGEAGGEAGGVKDGGLTCQFLTTQTSQYHDPDSGELCFSSGLQGP